MKTWLRTLLLVPFLALLGVRAEAGPILIGDDAGNIFSLDTGTGNASLVGNTGVGAMTDVAFDAAGNLWGIRPQAF